MGSATQKNMRLWVCDDGGLYTVCGGLRASCSFTCLRQCTM